jgi:5-(carboxyamino)imidazole ribonucleotide synthase
MSTVGTIGILGAGQLGRMLALAGIPLGLKFVFLDPSPEPCAAGLGNIIQAEYSDEAALLALCEQVDSVTYEFENVPAATAAFVAARKPLAPQVAALHTAQDRLNEKTLFQQLGIATPRFADIASHADLHTFCESGLPVVLKTRRMGYDGKGQAVIRRLEEIDSAWANLSGQALIAEGFVPFQREISCIGVRSHGGEMRFYPVAENQHRDGILRVSIPQADDPLQSQAEAATALVMQHLGYVGVMAFEFFVCDGQLIANEIAPRVHNSGHWSIEGAVCSQFENHLRAVCGLPLGSTALREACFMLNLIGCEANFDVWGQDAQTKIHWYGKVPKPQRKVGHLTVLDDPQRAVDYVARYGLH